MRPISYYLFTFAFLFLFSFSEAQVVINEYSASNLNQFKDNYGKTEDWIELYNVGNEDVDISGWYLSDKDSKPGKWKIPEGNILKAKEYALFWCSGRNESKYGIHHTNFKLSQTSLKDKVVLSDSQKNIVGEHELKITQVEHSNCRETDGALAWNICVNPTPGNSNNGSEQFYGYSQKPEMDMDAGFYADSVIVSINNNEANSSLHYTTDGSLPTQDSPLYETPINISESMVVKARAYSNDPKVLPGLIEFNTYFINEDFSLAVFSVGSEDVIDLANGNGGLIPIGSLEYFNINKQREAKSYGSLNRHGQDSWVLPHRSIDWVSRDEMGYSKALIAPIFSYSEREEYQRFMFRNSGDDNYPALPDNAHSGSTHLRDEYVQTLAHEGGMRLDTRAVERVILFLNGQYWGLYGMRERPVDHDYTSEYYDQDKYNLHFLTTWGTTKAEYGGLNAFNDWTQTRDFVLSNDMSNPENYNYLAEEVDLISYIDYFLVNMNVVARDWLNYNTAWWKGLNPDGGHKKWGYVLWDLDATFDYYINYTGIPNSSATASPCDIHAISSYMDQFFSNGGGGDEIEHPEDCNTIVEGSSPYPPDDPIFIEVINQDHFCCNNNWDNLCQEQYDIIANDSIFVDTCYTILNGSSPYNMEDPIFLATSQQKPECCTDDWNSECQFLYDQIEIQMGNEALSGNIGKHEKMFIKLQEESEAFNQLYYSRQADMLNTVFSCENMNATLDKMSELIRPEMPRQIERWGGTLEEWEENLESLYTFINQRCQLAEEGYVNCFELSGPFELTVECMPEEVANFDVNSLKSLSMPWTGKYFGNMQNTLNSNLNENYEEEYVFSHWESKSGQTIFQDPMSEISSFELIEKDTLVAVYELATEVEDLIFGMDFRVFPNPVKNDLHFEINMKEASAFKLDIYSVDGVLAKSIIESENKQHFKSKINFKNLQVEPGVYILKLETELGNLSKRIVFVE